MTLSTQPYKGARDFYPEDKRIQQYMFDTLSRVCEQFGYEPYDAPILEPTELYHAKGNQEIVNDQTYSFTDRGGRDVTVRTEMTPSVSRMVAGRRQELGYPLRWYSIPELWRYERTQRGRLRQFWQLNADIFGVEGVEADHEIIALADAILKAFGAKENMFTIHINHRGLTDLLFRDYFGLDEMRAAELVRLVDRRAKMSEESFVTAAAEILAAASNVPNPVESLQKLLAVQYISDIPTEFLDTKPVQELRKLDAMLAASGVTSVQFDMTLMRGFDYYTGIVFEVFDNHPDNNRAMFGGGRYDGLVGMFGVEPVPTVGFGMGDVTLQNFIESHELLPKLQVETDVYVVLIGEDMYEKSLKVISKLREMSVKVAVDMSGRKIDKQLKNAAKKGVRYALFIGENELDSGQFRLKDLASGTEETHSPERIASIVLAQ